MLRAEHLPQVPQAELLALRAAEGAFHAAVAEGSRAFTAAVDLLAAEGAFHAAVAVSAVSYGHFQGGTQ